MIVVSEKNIESSIAFFDQIDEKAASEISIRFAVEQPFVLIYLQTMSVFDDEEEDATEEDLEDTDDELNDNPLTEELTYYAMLIWRAFELEAGRIPLITEEEVETNTDASMAEMQHIIELTQNGDTEAIGKQFAMMRQPNLVGYLLLNFYGDAEEEGFDEQFDDEEANYLFLICNQLIMMFDKKVNGNAAAEQ